MTRRSGGACEHHKPVNREQLRTRPPATACVFTPPAAMLQEKNHSWLNMSVEQGWTPTGAIIKQKAISTGEPGVDSVQLDKYTLPQVSLLVPA